jgi:hypothetical protein
MKKCILLLSGLLLAGSMLAQSGSGVSSASIVPNPVESKAQVVFSEPVSENVTVWIKDLTGNTVYRMTFDGRNAVSSPVLLNLESLRKGLYICQVIGENGRIKTLKFQKS